MKAVILKSYGEADKLLYTDLDKPAAGEGEYLIRIKAAGVNPVDAKARRGYLKDRIPNVFPIIPGWDFAGVVEERGHGARRFETGDGVYGYARRTVYQYGTYAEYTVLPECFIAGKHSRISFQEAAAVRLAGLPPYQSLFQAAGLSDGREIVVLGASGGVGSFAVQFARINGAYIYAVASGGRAEYLQKLGAGHLIDYTKGSVSEQLESLLPDGADIVFDCVGGDATDEAYECVKKGGTIVSILSHGSEEKNEQNDVDFRYVFVEPNVPQLETIGRWIDEKRVKVPVSRVFELEDAANAHRQIETGHTQGKIVLRI